MNNAATTTDRNIEDIDITDPAEACYDAADARFLAAATGWNDTIVPGGFRHDDGRRARLTTTPAGDWFLRVN